MDIKFKLSVEIVRNEDDEGSFGVYVNVEGLPTRKTIELRYLETLISNHVASEYLADKTGWEKVEVR